MLEEVDGQFLVLEREENSLRLPARARSLQRDHPLNLTLRNAQHLQAAAPNVFRLSIQGRDAW